MIVTIMDIDYYIEESLVSMLGYSKEPSEEFLSMLNLQKEKFAKLKEREDKDISTIFDGKTVLILYDKEEMTRTGYMLRNILSYKYFKKASIKLAGYEEEINKHFDYIVFLSENIQPRVFYVSHYRYLKEKSHKNMVVLITKYSRMSKFNRWKIKDEELTETIVSDSAKKILNNIDALFRDEYLNT